METQELFKLVVKGLDGEDIASYAYAVGEKNVGISFEDFEIALPV